MCNGKVVTRDGQEIFGTMWSWLPRPEIGQTEPCWTCEIIDDIDGEGKVFHLRDLTECTVFKVQWTITDVIDLDVLDLARKDGWNGSD